MSFPQFNEISWLVNLLFFNFYSFFILLNFYFVLIKSFYKNIKISLLFFCL